MPPGPGATPMALKAWGPPAGPGAIGSRNGAIFVSADSHSRLPGPGSAECRPLAAGCRRGRGRPIEEWLRPPPWRSGSPVTGTVMPRAMYGDRSARTGSARGTEAAEWLS